MHNFNEIVPSAINENFIELISADWMLVTAGDKDGYNTMTASWGGIGEMWGKHMALVVIRPGRYTKEFVDRHERLTLSFFHEQHRQALAYCGSHSGRDGDKISDSGLSVTFTDNGTPAIAQARLVIECRKMYVGKFNEEGFLDKELLDKWYPERDMHYTYFCEVERAYIR